MESVILGLLVMQPMTAYDINGSFDQGISLFYSASYGSIQAALKRLLAKGLITFEARIENGRNKKVYNITSEGLSYFFEWMQSDIENRKNESIVLTKVFFLGLVEDIHIQKSIVKDIISTYEEMEQQLLTSQTEAKEHDINPDYQKIFKFQMKSLDYGLHNTVSSLAFYRKMLDEM